MNRGAADHSQLVAEEPAAAERLPAKPSRAGAMFASRGLAFGLVAAGLCIVALFESSGDGAGVVPVARAAEPAQKKQERAADYRLVLVAPSRVEVGAASAVSLTVAPAAGFSISGDAPLVIAVSATPSGLRFARERYRVRHAADARAQAPRFDLRFRAERAGEFDMKIVLRFWVCAKRTCRPVREQRHVRFIAARPVPAPPAESPPEAPASSSGDPG